MHGDSFLPHVNQHPGQKIQIQYYQQIPLFCFFCSPMMSAQNVGRPNITQNHRLTRTWNLNSCKSPHPGLKPDSTINYLVTHMDSTAYKLCMEFKRWLQAFLSHAMLHFCDWTCRSVSLSHNRSGRNQYEKDRSMSIQSKKRVSDNSPTDLPCLLLWSNDHRDSVWRRC